VPGKLSVILLAAPRRTFEACRDRFKAMGTRTIFHVGGLGQGLAIEARARTTCSSRSTWCLAEALVLGRQGRALDPQELYEGRDGSPRGNQLGLRARCGTGLLVARLVAAGRHRRTSRSRTRSYETAFAKQLGAPPFLPGQREPCRSINGARRRLGKQDGSSDHSRCSEKLAGVKVGGLLNRSRGAPPRLRRAVVRASGGLGGPLVGLHGPSPFSFRSRISRRDPAQVLLVLEAPRSAGATTGNLSSGRRGSPRRRAGPGTVVGPGKKTSLIGVRRVNVDRGHVTPRRAQALEPRLHDSHHGCAAFSRIAAEG
jgi:hypothetical protein